MYGIPELDFETIVGHHTTQLQVGQFDLQFTLGPIHFNVQSPIEVWKDGALVGAWDAVSWPPSVFYDVMNVEVKGVALADSKKLRIMFENGLEVVLCDDSEQYETMQISVGGRAAGKTYIV
jgi:hypothetical protein